MDENEEINLDFAYDDVDHQASRMLVDLKVRTPRNIAYFVLLVFAATLAILLVGGIVLLSSRSVADGEGIMTKAFIPYLQSLASFMAGVFGTPLGFILGYFFSKHKND